MKKTTKPAKTLTPAKKPAKTVRKKTAAAAPAAEKVAAVAVVTKIVANFAVGFGNALYVRGDGPGLSWEKGIPMECVDDTTWAITLQGAVGPIPFKFLINDEKWSTGEDFVVAPGGSVTLTPSF